jgi:hypothetical protein
MEPFEKELAVLRLVRPSPELKKRILEKMEERSFTGAWSIRGKTFLNHAFLPNRLVLAGLVIAWAFIVVFHCATPENVLPDAGLSRLAVRRLLLQERSLAAELQHWEDLEKEGNPSHDVRFRFKLKAQKEG